MDMQRFIELCKNGDEQALGLLYKRYAPKMKRLCQRYVHDERTAEDILYDGFIIIMSSIHQLSEAAKLEGWMAAIMRNLALRYAKRNGRVLLVPVEEIEDDENFTASPISTVSDYKEFLRLVETMSDGYKRVFKLSVFDGMTHAEIGELLGINAHSSSSQLARAKSIMRALAVKYGFVPITIIALLFALRLETPVWKEKSKGRKVKDLPTKSVVSSYKKDATPTIVRQGAMTKASKLAVADTTTTLQKSAKEDSVPTQKTDTLRQTNTYIAEKEERRGENIVTPLDYSAKEKVPLVAQNSSFTLSLSYSGASEMSRNAVTERKGTGSDIGSGVDKPIEKVETKTHHRTPFVVSLSLQKALSHRWSIGTGVRYSRLTTDFTAITPNQTTVTTQTIQYIGVPITISYNLWRSGNFSLYTSFGVAADIPVKSEEKLLEATNASSVVLNPSAKTGLMDKK